MYVFILKYLRFYVEPLHTEKGQYPFPKVLNLKKQHTKTYRNNHDNIVIQYLENVTDTLSSSTKALIQSR